MAAHGKSEPIMTPEIMSQLKSTMNMLGKLKEDQERSISSYNNGQGDVDDVSSKVGALQSLLDRLNGVLEDGSVSDFSFYN